MEIEDPVLGRLRMPGIVPRMSRSLGEVRRLAPALGEHNEEVYEGLLGYTARELADLERRGVI